MIRRVTLKDRGRVSGVVKLKVSPYHRTRLVGMTLDLRVWPKETAVARIFPTDQVSAIGGSIKPLSGMLYFVEPLDRSDAMT